MVSVAGFGEILRRRGLSEELIKKISEDLLKRCPWVQDKVAASTEEQAQRRFQDLENFLHENGLAIDDLFEEEFSEERWNEVFQGVVACLAPFGKNDGLMNGDFWVVEDFYGTPQVLVDVYNGALPLKPLQDALLRFLHESAPEFQILIHESAPGSDRTTVLAVNGT